jgi:hypothetical protein
LRVCGLDLGHPLAGVGSPNDPRALLEPILAMIEGGETLRHVRDALAMLTKKG